MTSVLLYATVAAVLVVLIVKGLWSKPEDLGSVSPSYMREKGWWAR